MSARVVRFAHAPNTVALALLALFAAGLLGIGLTCVLAAGRIHAAQPDLAAAPLRLGGALLALVGAGLGSIVVRHGPAVAAIEVAADGAWLLRSRLGRGVARIAPGERRALALRGEKALVFNPASTRTLSQVSCLLTVEDGRRFRLASGGRFSFGEALAALGYPGPAPAPGEQRELPWHRYGPAGPLW
jgi:hypothetical protein